MIYTCPEVKKLLNAAIPAEADKNIVVSSLVEILLGLQESHEMNFAALICRLIPEKMQVQEVIKSIIEAVSVVALSAAQPDRLFSALDVLRGELTVQYMKNLAFAAQEVSFKAHHAPELRRFVHGEDTAPHCDSEFTALIKKYIEV